MFENVPEWLTEKVNGLRETVDAALREQVYYEAAGWTIAWYLRMDITDLAGDDFIPFPGKEEITKGDLLPHAFVNRAIQVAETLFLLRSSPGFAEQRRRLEKKSLRPMFFEMLAAKQFFKAGFEIYARQEIGVRGEDFDFIAKRGEEAVNVEVTALTADEFSEKTILNALRHKRKQLPNNAPAVLYCVLPEHWLGQGRNWNATLEGVANNFFSGTRRINVVVFWVEEHIDRGGGMAGGALVLTRMPYGNANPRHPADFSFLFGGMRTQIAREAVATGDGLESLEKSSYDSEFFRWIDHLVPPPKEAR